MEKFDQKYRAFGSHITEEVKNVVSLFNRAYSKIKLLNVFFSLIPAVLLIQSLTAMWAINTQFGSSTGFPFGEYSKVLI